MEANKVSKEDGQFRLRMPEDIKDWIRVRAKANMRSMTAEIIFILNEKMENEKSATPA